MDTRTRGRAATPRRALTTASVTAVLALAAGPARAGEGPSLPPSSSGVLEPLAFILGPILVILALPIAVIAMLVIAGERMHRRRTRDRRPAHRGSDGGRARHRRPRGDGSPGAFAGVEEEYDEQHGAEAAFDDPFTDDFGSGWDGESSGAESSSDGGGGGADGGGGGG